MALESFRDYLVTHDRSERTIAGYLYAAERFDRWLRAQGEDGLSPQNLTAEDVRAFRQNLAEQGAQPSTLNAYLAALRAYASWCVEAGLLQSDPLRWLHSTREQALAPKWLTHKEQSAVVREAERALAAARTEAKRLDAQRDLSLIVLLLNTGLRISEACELEPGDAELHERSGRLTVRSGKGAKRRVLPLNRAARQALADWMALRPAGAATLFTTTLGKPFNYAAAYRRLAELGRRAKVALHPHTLRHTFAKNLVDSGVGLEQVAALLGHESLNTTRVYTIPSQQDLERAVSHLDF